MLTTAAPGEAVASVSPWAALLWVVEWLRMMWTTFHRSHITNLHQYGSNPEDEEERNGYDLVKVQLRLQAEGKWFDTRSFLILIPMDQVSHACKPLATLQCPVSLRR